MESNSGAHWSLKRQIGSEKDRQRCGLQLAPGGASVSHTRGQSVWRHILWDYEEAASWQTVRIWLFILRMRKSWVLSGTQKHLSQTWLPGSADWVLDFVTGEWRERDSNRVSASAWEKSLTFMWQECWRQGEKGHIVWERGI